MAHLLMCRFHLGVKCRFSDQIAFQSFNNHFVEVYPVFPRIKRRLSVKIGSRAYIKRTFKRLFRLFSLFFAKLKIIVHSVFESILQASNVRSLIADKRTDKFNLPMKNTVFPTVLNRAKIAFMR